MRLVPSRPMSPFPLPSEVIWLWFVPGAFPSVTLWACGPFTQSGLCGIARAILHSSLRCITSFLPSFLVRTEHFLSSPHSCLLTLPTVNFASVPFPLSVALEAVTVFCNAENEQGGGRKSSLFSFWFCASALSSHSLFTTPPSFLMG